MENLKTQSEEYLLCLRRGDIRESITTKKEEIKMNQ